MRKFEAKIRDFIERHRLLDRDGRYLVALSGGADSVCLLLVLQRLGFSIEAAHCNFHLRGDESDRDERFCETLCAEQNVRFHRVDFDTFSYARQHKISIEMAARELRYNYFNQLLESYGFQGVCVAHHADDNAETLLLHLLRGSGLHGLTGMSPRRGFVLRPMLEVRRDEIEEFLSLQGQNFVTDSTNRCTDHVRNKIRLEILPKLKEINPSAVDELCLTARHLTDAEIVLDAALEQGKNAVSSVISDREPLLFRIDIPQLLAQPSPRYLLYHLLAPQGFNRQQIEQIFDALSQHAGRQWYSPDHTLTLDRDCLVLSRRQGEHPEAVEIGGAGSFSLGNAVLQVEIFPKTADFIVSKEPKIATLDADKVAFPLTWRRVGQGDRFVPFGMAGSKLVSDFLTDRKKSLAEKQQQTLVADATGRLVWLVAERPDNRFAVTPKTENILRLTLQKNQ
ncbi:MAG: tRNA lysidine(34) synthetase TilS [Prevotella sp.]|nr:tRNA lysidine(34) synthetase TilS [Prevotella sp.]